ncbi:hypothetical protein OAQ99_05170 [Candidatus Kapabacteria bacterium]|nr:hypothetical protein [Candidatus Kapabacteria bacterium]
MKKKEIKVGNSILKLKNQVKSEKVKIEGRDCIKISNYDTMDFFFMNIVSNSNLWMFISSNGSLTAGRKNSDFSLFPYYTVDKIHDSVKQTGSKTIIQVEKDNQIFLWEPFSSNYEGVYNVQRNIYKSVIGNFILFEEINHDLELSFSYSWSNADKFGFIRNSKIQNLSTANIKISIVDGLQNLLPAELNVRLQNEFSNLVDAYKKAEYFTEKKMAAFTLSSIPTDRAEPNESLKANVAWQCGLVNHKILLSNSQLENFKQGDNLKSESINRGNRISFLVNSDFILGGNQDKSWKIIIDANKSQSEFISLSNYILSGNNLLKVIDEEILSDREKLIVKIAKNDGVQYVNDDLSNFRHASNTLFNIMRGGVFENDYSISKKDFIGFVSKANHKVTSECELILSNFDKSFSFNELMDAIPDSNQDLERLAYEYMPLSFSRRHGDPSRPWNHFSIDLKDDSGNPKLDYQGNWRDLFQNWEAISLSYPDFVEKMIAKFVNASTADGYNPYKVTRDGFDWEIIEPDDEWSYIGYWGDHQIIYLLKLLEISGKYNPEKLEKLLSKNIFAYANVPYKIKTYEEILENPQDTIEFDFELDDKISNKVNEIGFDAKFQFDQENQISYTNLAEKLLLPLLVKLSNFVPGAGIWMNTQRPEWNDANNALVGYGASMVTVYYIKRYVRFLSDLLNTISLKSFDMHEEVASFFVSLSEYYIKASKTHIKLNDNQRKEFVDTIGKIGSNYRSVIYESGFSCNRSEISIKNTFDFLKAVELFLDETIKTNRRDDNLYHSYNLLAISENRIGVKRLYEMLEGQVAILSAGVLDVSESIKLLKALRLSTLYRENQNSYMLYPNRSLPSFLDKNSFSSGKFEKYSEIKSFLQNLNNGIILIDENGSWHFNSQFKNSGFLKEELNKKFEKGEINQKATEQLLELYEDVFDHKSFTGRSGTFFRFEGLGSIYWHMVSKLLLSVQETYYKAANETVSNEELLELKNIYYDIKEGIGVHKNPKEYGSFPTDAYSHTPENSGVQQPGMTGQVKEDIISRFGELGVRVDNGEISFDLTLLQESEFLQEGREIIYIDVVGNKNFIKLEHKQLAFTLCQVLVVYKKSNQNRVLVHIDDAIEESPELKINKEISRTIFQRENRVSKIEVEIYHN